MSVLSPERRAFSDAAKRVCNEFNMHAFVGNYGQWVAFRLSDGTSDGVTYPTRDSALAHQNPLYGYMVVRILPNGLTPEDAERLLVLYRNFHDRGHRESVDQPSFILPATQEDMSHWIERSNR